MNSSGPCDPLIESGVASSSGKPTHYGGHWQERSASSFEYSYTELAAEVQQWVASQDRAGGGDPTIYTKFTQRWLTSSTAARFVQAHAEAVVLPVFFPSGAEAARGTGVRVSLLEVLASSAPPPLRSLNFTFKLLLTALGSGEGEGQRSGLSSRSYAHACLWFLQRLEEGVTWLESFSEAKDGGADKYKTRVTLVGFAASYVVSSLRARQDLLFSGTRDGMVCEGIRNSKTGRASCSGSPLRCAFIGLCCLHGRMMALLSAERNDDRAKELQTLVERRVRVGLQELASGWAALPSAARESSELLSALVESDSGHSSGPRVEAISALSRVLSFAEGVAAAPGGGDDGGVPTRVCVALLLAWLPGVSCHSVLSSEPVLGQRVEALKYRLPLPEVWMASDEDRNEETDETLSFRWQNGMNRLLLRLLEWSGSASKPVVSLLTAALSDFIRAACLAPKDSPMLSLVFHRMVRCVCLPFWVQVWKRSSDGTEKGLREILEAWLVTGSALLSGRGDSCEPDSILGALLISVWSDAYCTAASGCRPLRLPSAVYACICAAPTSSDTHFFLALVDLQFIHHCVLHRKNGKNVSFAVATNDSLALLQKLRVSAELDGLDPAWESWAAVRLPVLLAAVATGSAGDMSVMVRELGERLWGAVERAGLKMLCVELLSLDPLPGTEELLQHLLCGPSPAALNLGLFHRALFTAQHLTALWTLARHRVDIPLSSIALDASQTAEFARLLHSSEPPPSLPLTTEDLSWWKALEVKARPCSSRTEDKALMRSIAASTEQLHALWCKAASREAVAIPSAVTAEMTELVDLWEKMRERAGEGGLAEGPAL